MPMREALRLCPSAIVQPHRFAAYREVARQIQNIFARFTPLVEPLSLDEAFLDVAGSEACLGQPEVIARQIKQLIRQETALVASVGVAPIKFVAKIASDAAKPDGFVVVTADELMDFLGPLHVQRLWGVGKATLPKLARLGIEKIADLRKFTPDRLAQELGQQGRDLWELAHGIDPRPVVPQREPQSISHEETFDEDLTDSATLATELHSLTDEVAHRLRADKFLATTVTVKIRLASFQTITRQQTLSDPTDQTSTIWETVQRIWNAWKRPGKQGIRLLGVGLAGLVRPTARQLSLFEDQQNPPDQRIDSAVDAIRLRFGNDSLKSADLLRRPPRS